MNRRQAWAVEIGKKNSSGRLQVRSSIVARTVGWDDLASRKRRLVKREIRRRGMTKSGIKLKRRFSDLQ